MKVLHEFLLDNEVMQTVTYFIQREEDFYKAKEDRKDSLQKSKSERVEAWKRKWDVINKFRKRWLCPQISFVAKNGEKS